jgi:hypothetical protein
MNRHQDRGEGDEPADLRHQSGAIVSARPIGKPNDRVEELVKSDLLIDRLLCALKGERPPGRHLESAFPSRTKTLECLPEKGGWVLDMLENLGAKQQIRIPGFRRPFASDEVHGIRRGRQASQLGGTPILVARRDGG